MPKAFPREFRGDVVAVAQRRQAGVTIKQIADDFGTSEGCLQNWLRQAEIEAGKRPGTTQAESAELRELCKRNRLLEQENEVLRQAAAYLSQANLPVKALPARERAGRGRYPRRGHTRALPCEPGCSSSLVSRITGG